MADTFDHETRSRIMRSVRTRRTEPEESLARILGQLGLRVRRNDRRLVGTPDFSCPPHRLAIFVDGDFWHGRAWFERAKAPATNSAFWIRKFEINRTHDQLVNRKLRRLGWSVLRIWSSEIRRDPVGTARRVEVRLRILKRTQRSLATGQEPHAVVKKVVSRTMGDRTNTPQVKRYKRQVR
jgi:DNA mismatch endonuclease (patch repair protein)